MFFADKKSGPQGLKPASLAVLDGTAEALHPSKRKPRLLRTPAVPFPLAVRGGMAEEAAEKVPSITSAAKAAEEKQSSYRSAKALRHPKSEFFAAGKAVSCAESL